MKNLNSIVGIITYHKSLSYGACLQAIATQECVRSDSVNVYSICISSSFTEVIVFLYRFIIWKKNKELEEQE